MPLARFHKSLETWILCDRLDVHNNAYDVALNELVF